MPVAVQDPDPVAEPGALRQLGYRPAQIDEILTKGKTDFKIPILSPSRDGAWGDASTAGYVFASAAIALAATGMMHLLLLSTPYPRIFFGWIIGLATVVAVIFPFSTTAPLSQKFATAVVNLVLGVAIGSLIGEVSRRAGRRQVVRRGSGRPSYPPSRTAGDGYS